MMLRDNGKAVYQLQGEEDFVLQRTLPLVPAPPSPNILLAVANSDQLSTVLCVVGLLSTFPCFCPKVCVYVVVLSVTVYVQI